jgi:predicted transposase/invertase (TIGR01784 family)
MCKVNNNQNPARHEREPFLFGDGKSVPDIRYDTVFKAVFTKDTSESRGALSDLISAFIMRAVEVDTVIANEPSVDDKRQRCIRFNAICKTKEGELVNVEMSINPGAVEPVCFEYYAAKLFVGQDVHGEDGVYGEEEKYDNLKDTYQITILVNDKLFQDEEIMHNFLYYDPETGVSFGGKVAIITVELVKTKPIVDRSVEEMTNAEAWAVFFQYLTDEGKRAKIIEIINHEKGIAMAAETLGQFTQNEIEYIQELSKLKRELDYQNDMACAEDKGRAEASLDIARNLKRMGLPISQIVEGTGLSPEVIAQL